MAAGVEDSLSLDSRIELRDEEEQFDTATYVAAVAFNNAALPPDMPEWLKSLIEGQAVAVRQATGSSSLGEFDLASPEAKREREKRTENAADMQMAVLQQQQRDEWARTEHSFAGATMTGREWSELGGELKRDGKLRDWLIRELMNDGGSKADATRKADQIADIATIMGKPQSEWNAADRAKVEQGKADPQIQKVMTKLAEQRLNTDSTLTQTAAAHDNRETSVAIGADAFNSAPPLKEHHAAAVVASVPLDRAKIPPPAADMPPAIQPNMAGLNLWAYCPIRRSASAV